MSGGILLIFTGIALGVTGWLLLRRGGDGWRIGRLLAVAPQRSLAEALAVGAPPLAELAVATHVPNVKLIGARL